MVATDKICFCPLKFLLFLLILQWFLILGMKILHTADWHLGETFFGYEREEEHQYFLNRLLQIVGEQQPDALLLSGNVFDNPFPSSAAEKLFYHFLQRATQENEGMQVVFTGGAQESPQRLDTCSELFDGLGIKSRSIVKRDDAGRTDYEHLLIPISSRTNADDKMVVLTVPYLREGKSARKNLIEELTKAARNKYGRECPLILMTSFYPDEDLKNFGLTDEAQDFVYLACGGNDTPQAAGIHEHAGYPGSALMRSFSERGHEHGVYVGHFDADNPPQMDWMVCEPLRQMISIPEEGTAGIEDILRQLSKLPKGNNEEKSHTAPYVEVKIAEQQTTPAMLQAVVRTLDERKVRLCRVRRVRPNGEEAEPPIPAAAEMRVQAAQLARNAYKKAYHEEMPDELARLFAQAKREAADYQ
jgi:exonuclease SbcD